MPLLNTMIERLNTRINRAAAPYAQFIYFADVHYKFDASNSGFEKILNQIKTLEMDKTLFILIGGDMIDNGKTQNYSSFIDRCNSYYLETGIPIIPTMGNHEFYSVEPNVDEISRYRYYMGNINYPLDIPAKGLGDSLRVVAFNDAKPHKTEKISYPNISKGKNCTTQKKTKHLFYFPFSYINLTSTAPEKYSHFPDYLETSAHHVIVTMHVPPRKDPLPAMLDSFIQNEYAACLKVNPIISMPVLKTYYRNLWMLVHGNSTTNKNDSTQWFVDEIKKRGKVELVLMGHVHTFYPFPLLEANHDLQLVISGGGGNNSASAYSTAYPVTKYHYMRVKYDAGVNRFVYEKVDAGN